MQSQILVTNEIYTVNKLGSIESDDELIEKYGKLSKSQKSAKSRKKLSKSRNLFNFNIKENVPSFLSPDARTAFNYL